VGLRQEMFTKLVFKGEIKRELYERLEKWVNMDNTKNLPKDKQIKYHLRLMQEIKVKRKMVLIKILPIIDPNLRENFLEEVKTN
jgi:hypothetical protein